MIEKRRNNGLIEYRYIPEDWYNTHPCWKCGEVGHFPVECGKK